MNYALPDPVRLALSDRRVLVTGARGFLGKHFVQALREIGADVAEFDITITAFHDVSKPQPFTRSLDYLIHAAGIASPYHYRKNPWGALSASVQGTENMLELARAKGAKFLFLSSSEIYGDPTIVPTPETYTGASDPVGERACYDEGKRVAETLCSMVAREGVGAKIVRLFNAYGPGMSPDDRRFMPELRNAYRSGKPMRIFGTGEQTRTFAFVSDVIRGCLQALVSGKPGRAYNIGASGPELSMLDVCKLANVPIEVIPAPDDWPSGGDPNRRCPDISRAREELGYEPSVSFEDGLREFLKS